MFYTWKSIHIFRAKKKAYISYAFLYMLDLDLFICLFFRRERSVHIASDVLANLSKERLHWQMWH